MRCSRGRPRLHIEVFRRDPKRFWDFYGRRPHTLDDKRPNRAHELLAAWERRRRLDAVITQNIDGVPRCDQGHPLEPDIVLFGEDLPIAALAQASEFSRTADLMLCIGTSLEAVEASLNPAGE
ncbi:MAG TPA: Sir2 family NAD-dependent protein deacetylase [Solirubrobacteraceae bacterium]|nr:Sir2 family NAD-dependent protein deacetylase [Solirubrobacteraceae bacterium]